MQDKLYIIGCGGHARSVADTVLDNSPDAEIIFVDKNAKKNEKILGFSVIKKLPETASNVFIAIGNNEERQKLSRHCKPISIISKRAYVGSEAIIGNGCYVGNGAFIGSQCKIGDGTIINTNAVVEHECQVGQYCHIAPNSCICGRCFLGDNVFLGVGSSIKEKITICSDVTLGAGCVVVKNIATPGIYMGVPAVLRLNKK